MEDNLRWKMTFNGKRLSMEDVLRWKTTFNGRRPPFDGGTLGGKTSFDGRQPLKENRFRP